MTENSSIVNRSNLKSQNFEIALILRRQKNSINRLIYESNVELIKFMVSSIAKYDLVAHLIK